MSAAAVEAPRLMHALPGRMRVHLPEWSGDGQRALETRLRQVPGVRSAQANPLTGNVLIQFDPAVTDAHTLLALVRPRAQELSSVPADEPPLPPALIERHGQTRRARIAVRGLDRDPDLARRIVERLERHPGVVRASANPLTGRVLVECTDQEGALDSLLAEVSALELPGLPGEDRPSHPLDPEPLVRSATRTVGAALGLGLLAARRLAGQVGSPVSTTGPAVTAGVIGLLEGFPALRNGVRRLLGPTTADLLFGTAGLLSLTLAGSPLGLAVTGAAALRLVTEVLARRTAWRRYEERVEHAAAAHPGAVIRLEAGERTPRAATVLEGSGTATGHDGLPVRAAPGDSLPAGAQLYGGPFVVELQRAEPFILEPRSNTVPKAVSDRYAQAMGPLALAYAAVTALVTRSLSHAFTALLLVNPRAGLIGAETATAGAAARVLRSGVTVVGTRPDRIVRLPRVLLLDGPRLLADGLEVNAVLPLTEADDAAEILARAAGVAAAAGSPWGGAFRAAGGLPTNGGAFDGRAATAYVGGVPHWLGPVLDWAMLPAAIRLRHRGDYLLLLRRDHDEQPLGILALRPRLAPGLADLVRVCQRSGVQIAVLSGGDPVAAQAVAKRAGVPLLADTDAVAAIRARQAEGALVAFVSDHTEAGAAFAACDLAIGLTDGRSHFPARADLLAPDLGAVTAIIEAGARRQAAVRDSVALSVLANGIGALWGWQARPGVAQAAYPVSIATLGALAVGWARLRGGERPWSSVARLTDPHPERWGRRSVASVLHAFDTTEAGLSSAQAAERRRAAPPVVRRSRLLPAILDQMRSPLTAILAAGAGLSLILGATADVFMIGAMIVANAAAGVWQERQADRATEALERLGSVSARVLRDGHPVTVPADDIVPGDVLLLTRGDRVAADARLLNAQGLEVDEAALTGESLPVPKSPAGGTDASRIVLEGSDVTVGTGRAVVVAVGQQTRMGATAAALALDETHGQSPLTTRLHRLLRQFLPIAAAGGAVVALSGLVRRAPLLPQVALGASIAVAAVPEGLPLLAKVGEAAVGRRLASRYALVRRLSAVEALGRVDVACTDKTGTLTEGQLVVRLVADSDHEVTLPARLPPPVRQVLVTAALAGPHPDAPDARTDPTDVAVMQAAQAAGLGEHLRAARGAILQFDAARSFHAAVVEGRLCVEGAAEALIPRCHRVRRGGDDQPLGAADQEALLTRARQLAERGLRVLMVAEGPPDIPADDPRDLVALGFLGLSDPLRPGVPTAVRRCQEAGVRVIMVTGDHPATARAIAREAGLLGDDHDILTGAEIAAFDTRQLDQRLEQATVIARATPLDKLRIVESLQRGGHTVAMTGDGVNDAPALRLADVGVAMGRGGTEVARQAADVVLADDNFSTLVDAFVEGRSFWRNIRRALGLLLGGNLGELGLQVGTSILGLASPLTTRQILAVNLITDVLPALAVALQQPEHHDLTALAREGTSALEAPLRHEVVQRGLATTMPALASFLLALRSGSIPGARTVAFASIVTTQLAQTLDAGWAEGRLSRSVLGAVAGSAGLLAAALTVGPMREFLGLALPPPLGWALVGTGTLVAVLLGRVFAARALASPAGTLI